MRSVVVVLPASMCAMMPLLRTLAGSTAAFVAMVACLLSGVPPTRRPAAALDLLLPAVVSERAVGVGHLVGVLASLDGGAQSVAGVQQLVHQSLGHGLLATGAGVADQPAQREGVRPARLDVDRHLVSGTADAAGLDLDGRLDVLQSALE